MEFKINSRFPVVAFQATAIIAIALLGLRVAMTLLLRRRAQLRIDFTMTHRTAQGQLAQLIANPKSYPTAATILPPYQECPKIEWEIEAFAVANRPDWRENAGCSVVREVVAGDLKSYSELDPQAKSTARGQAQRH